MAKSYDEYIHHPSRWPTKKELHEVLAPMTADTILQILRGQGVYYGYDCERHCENDIRIYPFLVERDEEQIELDQQIYNAQIASRRAKRFADRVNRKVNIEAREFRRKYKRAILCVAIQFGINLEEAETRFRHIIGIP